MTHLSCDGSTRSTFKSGTRWEVDTHKQSATFNFQVQVYFTLRTPTLFFSHETVLGCSKQTTKSVDVVDDDAPCPRLSDSSSSVWQSSDYAILTLILTLRNTPHTRDYSTAKVREHHTLAGRLSSISPHEARRFRLSVEVEGLLSQYVHA